MKTVDFWLGCALCILTPSIAIAADDSAAPASEAATSSQSQPLSPPPPTWLAPQAAYRPTLTRPSTRLEGPLASMGRELETIGLYPRLTLVDEFAANTSGGQGQGHANSFAFPFGLDADLNKIVGWKGGSFHISMNQSVGSSLASTVTGNAVSFQTRYKLYQNLRLSALSLDQDLWNGAVNINAGRLSALTFFNASPLYCNFQNNAICFNPAVLPIQNKAMNFFPYGTWGGRLRINPAKTFYLQAGAFEADPALNPTDGFNWSTRTATGKVIAGEIGIQSASPKAAHAYHLRAGINYNDSPVSDPFLNTAGLSLVTSKGTALQHAGQTGWYVSGDLVVARLSGPGSRNVTIFASQVGTPADYTLFRSQSVLGAIWTGPFKSRPYDTFGVVGTFIGLGRQEVKLLQARRMAAGGTDQVHSGEGIIEVNYGLRLHRGIRLNPNIQYVITPDNIAMPNAVHQSRNILAFGLRLTIDAATLAGLPAWQ